MLIDRQNESITPITDEPLAQGATCLCFYSEIGLITNTQDGLLSMHKMNTTSPPTIRTEPEWSCCGLRSPGSVCVGDCGLIYVKSTNDKLIYVITEGVHNWPVFASQQLILTTLLNNIYTTYNSALYCI